MIEDLERVVRSVVASYLGQSRTIPVGVSNRHVHLSVQAKEALFGPGYQNVIMKELSQPGQFAMKETVTLVGPKGIIEGVRILGPERAETQVELMAGDTYKLGIPMVIRDSGDIENTPGLALVGPAGIVRLERGVIVAKRHVHASPSEAKELGIEDGQRIGLATSGARALEFREVLVRVNPDYRLEFHIDIEEANAAQLKNGDLVYLSE